MCGGGNGVLPYLIVEYFTTGVKVDGATLKKTEMARTKSIDVTWKLCHQLSKDVLPETKMR